MTYDIDTASSAYQASARMAGLGISIPLLLVRSYLGIRNQISPDTLDTSVPRVCRHRQCLLQPSKALLLLRTSV